MKRVVSLSGGKDSTAMLLMLLEKGEAVDEVVFFDTGMEFPEMREHLAKLENYTGIEFTRLRMDPSFEYLMFVRRLKRGKRKAENGYGWPRPNARWCTSYKTRTINKYLEKLSPDEVCIGIAADETGRNKNPPPSRYPLVEWGVTESDALSYCASSGFDWGGLYEKKNRVSCWCCPLQSLDDLRVLREFHPELWERLQEMDSLAYNTFRIDYDVNQLEAKFANENAQGLLDLVYTTEKS